MEHANAIKAKQWVEAVSHGRFGYEIETRGTKNLRVTLAHKGLIRAIFLVSQGVTDKDGNWPIGAIAVLIDNIGAAAVGSDVGEVKASVSFDVTYLSPVKLQEVVEIEAKVMNNHGKLTSVVVEIRRKENGEMVAFGKQWMVSFDVKEKIHSKL